MKRAMKIGGSFEAAGTIVSEFTTTAGEKRMVFEFDVPKGMLHIYRPDQLVVKPARENQCKCDNCEAWREYYAQKPVVVNQRLTQVCTACNGSGTQVRGGVFKDWNCSACNGTGQVLAVSQQRCPECDHTETHWNGSCHPGCDCTARWSPSKEHP